MYLGLVTYSAEALLEAYFASASAFFPKTSK